MSVMQRVKREKIMVVYLHQSIFVDKAFLLVLEGQNIHVLFMSLITFHHMF